jgi:hypothetical protein
MSESNWDQDNRIDPTAKPGMPVWAKFLLGCGIIAVLVLTTCIGGVAYLGHRIKKDPEGFKKNFEDKALGFARDMVRQPWEALRNVVDQLQTEEGSAALYAANPGLKERYPTSQSFVEAARDWRSKLEPLPPELPDLREGSLSINKNFGKTQRIEYRTKKGIRIRSEWQMESGAVGQLMDFQVD